MRLALNEAADPADRKYARQLKAAAILEELEPLYPDHPGIPHYIIHSYDYPGLAQLGLIAAARCGANSSLRPRTHCICRRTSTRCWACGTTSFVLILPQTPP